MAIENNGHAFGVFGPKGFPNISFMMCAGKLADYNTEAETIEEALAFFKYAHGVFGDAIFSKDSIGASILGEAYWNATLNYNMGSVEKIPPNGMFYNELRKRIERYEKGGFIIDKAWKDAI